MNRLLQHWVNLQAEARPDARAIVFGQEQLTYGELEQRSNQLARLLRAAGCKKGDRVGLLLPKSIPAIVSIIGTLKADCAYVPIDTASPAARAARMLSICESRVLLTSRASNKLVGELRGADAGLAASLRLGWMDSEPAESPAFDVAFGWSDLSACSAAVPPSDNTSADMAHLLFTSGSTGIPKGVVITHASVRHFVEWGVRHFGTAPSDRISCHPPLHFDLSTFDIFGTFAAGAELHLVPPELNLLPHRLADFIRDARLTQWFSVPSVLMHMAKFDAVRQDDFPALERLLWCGEAFPTPGLIHWMKKLPRVRFTNLYGPTEATIASSYYDVPRCPDDERAAIPIGRACPGEALMLLDEQMRPTPAGDIGDLYISGAGLSPGYWKDAEKTQSVFLTGMNGDGRVYKTGDLARVGDDGLFYLIGRADSQIKTRGYRIELGEIEAALSAIESLRESAVVAVKTDGFESTAICCAYVTRPGTEVSPRSLRKALSALLPAYMIPSQWMALAAMPLNANGKIDRPQLRERFQHDVSHAPQGDA